MDEGASGRTPGRFGCFGGENMELLQTFCRTLSLEPVVKRRTLRK